MDEKRQHTGEVDSAESPAALFRYAHLNLPFPAVERRWYARITMWLWNRRPAVDGFPKGFRVQLILSSAAMNVADLPHAEVEVLPK